MTTLTPAELGGMTRKARKALRCGKYKRIPNWLREEFADRKAQMCNQCERVLPFERLVIDSDSSTGFRSLCKECHTAYYRANREREVTRMRKYRASNSVWCRLVAGYGRAKKAGLPAETVTVEALYESWANRGIDPGVSVYSGVPLTPETFSLDHLVPLCDPDSPGHVAANIVPCTLSENYTKQGSHFIHLLGKIHAEPKEEK